MISRTLTLPRFCVEKAIFYLLRSGVQNQAFLGQLQLLGLSRPRIQVLLLVGGKQFKIILYYFQLDVVKGTMSRDFRPLLFFCLKDSTWAPYKQAKNSFANFFVFAKIFHHKVRKSQIHVVNLYADMQIFLKMRRFSNFQIVDIGFVCCVSVVVYYTDTMSVWSMTTPTSCLHSQ